MRKFRIIFPDRSERTVKADAVNVVSANEIQFIKTATFADSILPVLSRNKITPPTAPINITEIVAVLVPVPGTLVIAVGEETEPANAVA